MILHPRLRALAIPALAMLLLLGVLPALGQDGDFTANVTFETGGEANAMVMKAGAEHLRLDMSAAQGGASLVWGPTSMLMIMHEQRMYMEFTEEMMERMRGMMGAMGGAAPQMPESDSVDPTQYTFAATGATDDINGLAVFEVAMTGPEGQNARLWLSEDADMGLFEVFSRMASSLQRMSLPGAMSRMNPAAGMEQYMSLARAQGLPDGKVIRVVDGESGTTITLGEVAMGTLDPSTWQAPDGYEKQSMPMMQR